MAMEEFAAKMSQLATTLAAELAENVGQSRQYFTEHCNENTCFLRLNRYPPCPISSEVFGLVPHTDSDFLTILHQDEVGGLQMLKDSKWICVKPNPDSLIVNIGDLFQVCATKTPQDTVDTHKDTYVRHNFHRHRSELMLQNKGQYLKGFPTKLWAQNNL